MILLSADDVRNQSLQVWGQFGESLWIPNAKENAKLERYNLNDLEHFGIGKCVVLVAMGPSLENHIDAIKKYRDRIDLICCDKAFGPLLDHGVKADYCVVADAGIPYKFLEPYWRETKDVTLFATPYANPLWTKTWQGKRYFYLNQDAIGSEHIFKKIMGNDERMIPASSNVSNAMFVLLTDCNEKKNHNWSGYHRFFLVGYDYSWPHKGNYYAWGNPKPKRYYMTHRTLPDVTGQVVHTSENLLFSAKWLSSYITTFQLPVLNCSGQGILDLGRIYQLSEELPKINSDQWITNVIKDSFKGWKDSVISSNTSKNNYMNFREVLYNGNR